MQFLLRKYFTAEPFSVMDHVHGDSRHEVRTENKKKLASQAQIISAKLIICSKCRSGKLMK